MLVAAVALVLPLAACSSDDDGADPPAATAASPAPPEGVTLIGADEGMALLDERDDLVVIDVRTPEEFAEGHLPDAVNIDLQGSFEDEIATLDPDATYVVYCRSGNRSAVAAATMAEAGFTDVYDLGGIVDWQAAGGEVVVPTG